MKRSARNLSLHEIPDGSIDAGLLMLELVDPRREWTSEEIAFVCGCSVKNIQLAERRAMKKLRPAFVERLGWRSLISMENVNELDAPVWAVVTHDTVIVDQVTHAQAVATLQWLKPAYERDACLVTHDVVVRMNKPALSPDELAALISTEKAHETAA
jgi:hypothetical protein